VTVPARWSPTGKQRDKYFASKPDAEQFIAQTLKEHEEHGRQAVTAALAGVPAGTRRQPRTSAGDR
jgi:hypothetical protein